ncbi:hypothetical protein GCM10009555_042410 [Acrocarpospora macrocephala]|uniref:Ricin B lectin domain-containing protein n=1 Tax=Acrocarpospora macrocephala TaxID=150177 RepID=A0A5M3WW32_9ACTN|nr:hypothetical protein Amac_072740 [Acrocarpospora macrocephala]
MGINDARRLYQMRLYRVAAAAALCAMATTTVGATPAFANPGPAVVTESNPAAPSAALASWNCDGKRVIPTTRAAALGCIRSGPADTNYSRGVWDCDWQVDIWTEYKYATWALTHTCSNTLIGWDFVFGD